MHACSLGLATALPLVVSGCSTPWGELGLAEEGEGGGGGTVGSSGSPASAGPESADGWSGGVAEASSTGSSSDGEPGTSGGPADGCLAVSLPDDAVWVIEPSSRQVVPMAIDASTGSLYLWDDDGITSVDADGAQHAVMGPPLPSEYWHTRMLLDGEGRLGVFGVNEPLDTDGYMYGSWGFRVYSIASDPPVMLTEVFSDEDFESVMGRYPGLAFAGDGRTVWSWLETGLTLRNPDFSLVWQTFNPLDPVGNTGTEVGIDSMGRITHLRYAWQPGALARVGLDGVTQWSLALEYPRGMMIGSDDALYVRHGDSLERRSPEGELEWSIPVSGDFVGSPAGEVWMVDTEGMDRVWRHYSLDGEVQRCVRTGYQPGWTLVDLQGRIIWRTLGAIYAIDPP